MCVCIQHINFCLFNLIHLSILIFDTFKHLKFDFFYISTFSDKKYYLRAYNSFVSYLSVLQFVNFIVRDLFITTQSPRIIHRNYYSCAIFDEIQVSPDETMRVSNANNVSLNNCRCLLLMTLREKSRRRIIFLRFP